MNAGAVVVASTLFLSSSAYDRVRVQVGQMLKDAAYAASHVASIACKRSSTSISGDYQLGVALLTAKDADVIQEKLREEVEAQATAAVAVIRHRRPRKSASSEGMRGEASALEDGHPSWIDQPPPKTAFALQGDMFVANSMAAALTFEPPLPGLCSQPGADMAAYRAMLTAAGMVVSVTGTLETCAKVVQYELALASEHSAPAAQALRDAIAIVVSSCAAALADASHVLQDMPLWGPCYGARVAWRPRSPDFYSALRKELGSAADDVASRLGDTLVDDVVRPAPIAHGRGVFAILASCDAMLTRVAAVEAAIATALCVPAPAPSTAPGEDVKPGAEAGGAKADSKKAKMAAAMRPYLPTIKTLVIFGSGIIVWITTIKSMTALVTTIPRLFSSASTRRQGKHCACFGPQPVLACRAWCMHLCLCCSCVVLTSCCRCCSAA